MADPLIFAVNQRVWKELPEADRELLRQAAIDAGKWEIELSRNSEAKRLEDIRARGVEVTELSEAEQKAFADATRSVQDKWTSKIGADLVEAARTAVAK
ncbi:MAG TPA: C4-dicarboxylate ABC transporter, partial [Pseudomonas sp.]|nr:C4-dicarboxylate ABC transporter [Pseudomonas sp.]